MKVLITGANSLLGANITDELLKAGYAVRGMVRRKASIPFEAPGLEICEGSFAIPQAAARAVEGCQVIIHVAADTSHWSQSLSAYRKINVAGTRCLFEAARRYHVQKFIYVSTANTLGHGSLQSPGTEAAPFRHPFSRAAYARSKKEAEDLVLRLGKTTETEVIIVHPCFMIGAYDQRPSSGKILLRAYGKRLVAVPPGGKNFIHVRDAAIATVRAITRGKNGERYLLAGENMSYVTFYRRMRAVTKDRFRILVIPPLVLKVVGATGSLLAWCGISNAFYMNNIRILCVGNYYSARKAIDELGLPQTPVSTAVADATRWFVKSAMLPSRTTPRPHKPSYSN